MCFLLHVSLVLINPLTSGEREGKINYRKGGNLGRWTVLQSDETEETREVS